MAIPRFLLGILFLGFSATTPSLGAAPEVIGYTNGTATVVAEQIIAVVNGQLLFQSDLLRDQTFFSATTSTTEKLVDDKLLLIEAKRFVLAPPQEEEIDLAFKEIQKKFSDEAAFQNALKETGLTSAGLKREILDRLWVKKLIQDRITFFIFITDEEISQYYQQHQNDFLQHELQDAEAKIRAILEKEKETMKIREYLSRITSQANINVHVR